MVRSRPGRKWHVMFSSARSRVQRQVESVNKAARERPRGRDLNLHCRDAKIKVAIVHFLSVLQTNQKHCRRTACDATFRGSMNYSHWCGAFEIVVLSQINLFWGAKAKHKREFLIGTTNSTITASPWRPPVGRLINTTKLRTLCRWRLVCLFTSGGQWIKDILKCNCTLELRFCDQKKHLSTWLWRKAWLRLASAYSSIVGCFNKDCLHQPRCDYTHNITKVKLHGCFPSYIFSFLKSLSLRCFN